MLLTMNGITSVNIFTINLLVVDIGTAFGY